MTRAWVLSGGASKGAFTAGVVQKLLEDDPHLEFDYAIGTSTGALVAGPALLRDTDYLANAYTTMANDDILSNSFLGKIIGLPIGANMKPLHRLLKDYYLDSHHLADLINNRKTQVVSTVNVRTGKVHLISSEMVKTDQIRPETFVRAILASCSEPVFTEPVRIFENETASAYRNDLFYDGGVKEFMPFEHAVSLNVDEVWGVSTHRPVPAETDWGGDRSSDRVSIFDALKWTVSTLLDEISRGDMYRADTYFRYRKAVDGLKAVATAKELSVQDIEALLEPLEAITPLGHGLKKLYCIYPSQRMHTSLDFDERIMMGYLRAGRRDAQKFLEAGKPEFTNETLAPWADQLE